MAKPKTDDNVYAEIRRRVTREVAAEAAAAKQAGHARTIAKAAEQARAAMRRS